MLQGNAEQASVCTVVRIVECSLSARLQTAQYVVGSPVACAAFSWTAIRDRQICNKCNPTGQPLPCMPSHLQKRFAYKCAT